ncbi:MAG: hypothetical protein AAF213_08765 [Pseudomonadota bacterium]
MSNALGSPMNDETPDRAAHIDAVESGRVYGWAWDASDPEKRQIVAIFCGDQVLGTVVADRHRVDLATRDIGDGRHAFVFDLPPTAKDRPAEEFQAKIDRGNIALSRLPKVFTINQDGRVDSVEKKPDSNQSNVKDPGEVAHALQEQVKAISTRLDQVDQNYGKMTDLLTRMDKRLTADTAALQKQITSQPSRDDGAATPRAQPAASTTAAPTASPAAPSTMGAAPGINADDFQKLRQYVRVCWRDIKRLRGDLGTVESFTLRFDERLKETAAQQDVEEVRQSTKTTRGVMWIAVIMAALSLVLSAYAAFLG